MRKLLVTSQKAGVGKTTTAVNLATAVASAGSRTLLVDADPLSTISTSLNLAQHPQRRPMQEVRKDLPGIMVSEVVPGVDLISPYEEGGCSDEALESLLRLLAAPAVQDCYGCLVVNTPPFMGTNPSQLVRSCDEYILVMRAEAMAHRTLPAFMELVQRSQNKPHTMQMRGIVLTLAEGEQPGGRWERELRGRLGGRVLPQIIPHDEEVTRALLFGQVVTHSNPHSPAAIQYRQLADKLGLALEGRSTAASEVSSALAVAASAARTAEQDRAFGLDGRSIADAAKTGPATPGTRPKAPLSNLRARPSAPGTTARKAPAAGKSGDTLPPTRNPGAPRRPGAPAAPTPAASAAAAGPATPRAATAARKPSPATMPTVRAHVHAGPGPYGWVIWMIAAVSVGIALRFLPNSKEMLPFVVGVGVGSLVVLLLWGLTKPVVTTTPAQPRQPGNKPPASPQAKKSDVTTRLNGLTAPPKRPAGGGPRGK